MFKKFVNKGLPMSVLLILSAVVQGYAVRAFADEAAAPAGGRFCDSDHVPAAAQHEP